MKPPQWVRELCDFGLPVAVAEKLNQAGIYSTEEWARHHMPIPHEQILDEAESVQYIRAFWASIGRPLAAGKRSPTTAESSDRDTH